MLDAHAEEAYWPPLNLIHLFKWRDPIIDGGYQERRFGWNAVVGAVLPYQLPANRQLFSTMSNLNL